MRAERLPPPPALPLVRVPCLVAALLLAFQPAGDACAQRSAPQRSTNVLDPAKLPSQYRATRWTGSEGLPQSVVDAFAQTADGYLWVATQQGAGRFDGHGFDAFTTASHPTLRSNKMNALAADPTGALWLGTADGLARLAPDGALALFDAAHGLPDVPIYALAATGQHLWVGTSEGLCWSALQTLRFACTADGLPGPYIGTLLAYDDGVWIGTDGGLAWFDGQDVHSYAGRREALAAPVLALAEAGASGANASAADRGLWVGTLAGLTRITPVDGDPARTTAAAVRLVPDFEGDVVTALAEDPAGALWVGTDGRGLHRLYQSRAEHLPVILGQDAPSISALLLDHEGGLWASVTAQGVVHLRDAKLTPFGEPEGLGASTVYSVAEGRDGSVYVGTDGGGVSRIRGGRVAETLRADGPAGLPSDFVNAVLETRDGALWVGTNGDGLARCVQRRCTTFGVDDGLPDPYVLALFEASDGTLWIGTDGGLVRARGSRLLPATLSVEDGLGSASVNAFAETDDGALWVGTYGGGLSRITNGRGGPHVDETLTAADGLAHDVVLDLHASPDGCLWAGTFGGGLSRLCGEGDARTFATYSTREGLPSDAVLSLLEDDLGALWLNTERGIYRLDRDDLRPDLDGAVRLRPARFGTADGARSAEGTGGVGPAALRARDGRLWFPTIDGVVALDPAALPVNTVAPPVAVQRVLVGEVPQPLGAARAGTLALSPGSREFEIDYAALSFFAPEAVRFRYRLDGRDDGWSEPVARRQAFYTDLPPGAYTFRVQAANNDGVWNDLGAAVTFTLEPFFYQTTWFLLLCVVAGALTVYGGYHLRVRQLHRRALRLEALVTERTHELAAEKERVETQKSVIEAQAGELRVLNEHLEQRVREQLAEIVRGSRLRKFFSKKVVDRILDADEGVLVTNERKRVTILFSDLKGFTQFSDTTDPGVVTGMLNGYLTEMVALVEAHGGTLDKFMGDGIMALFGAADQMPPDEQARQAVRCAAAMQHRFRRLRAAWAEAHLPHDLDLRVGVNQAEVTVGNFGSDDLVDYTAIGQGVNLAARLEGACTPGQALVSFPVYALTKEAFPFSDEQAYHLKGIERAVPAYTLHTDRVEGADDGPLLSLTPDTLEPTPSEADASAVDAAAVDAATVEG